MKIEQVKITARELSLKFPQQTKREGERASQCKSSPLFQGIKSLNCSRSHYCYKHKYKIFKLSCSSLFQGMKFLNCSFNIALQAQEFHHVQIPVSLIGVAKNERNKRENIKCNTNKNTTIGEMNNFGLR